MLTQEFQNEVNAILSDRKFWETAVIDILNSMYAPLDEKGNIIQECQAALTYKKQRGIV